MRIQEYLSLFMDDQQIVQDPAPIIENVKKLKNLLEQRLQTYIHTRPENVKFLQQQSQLTKEQLEQQNASYEFVQSTLYGNLTGEDELTLIKIQEQYNTRCFELIKQEGKNPLQYLVPREFIQENQLEQLLDNGNALDSFLFVHWMWFRDFFQKKRQQKINIKQFIDMLFQSTDPNKLDILCVRNKETLENYQTYKSILEDSNLGHFYQSKIEYHISLLAEYATQIYKDDSLIIRTVFAQICERLIVYPQLITMIAMKSIEYLLILIDMQSYDIKNLSITIQVPQVCVSELFTPMKSQQFRKQDEDQLSLKKRQYNDIVNGLPTWDVIQEAKFDKYIDYKSNIKQVQQTINDIDNITSNQNQM